MKSNHRSPIWPYLLVLSGLFALCVTAPRRWENRNPHREPAGHRYTAKASFDTPEKPAIVLRAQSSPAAHGSPVTQYGNEVEPKLAHASLFAASMPKTLSSSTASGEMPKGHSAADADTSGAARNSDAADSAEGESPSESFVSLGGEPSEEAAFGHSQGDDSRYGSTVDDAIDENPALNYEHWPLPYALVERMERLGGHRRARAWSEPISALIDRLAQTRLDDRAAVGLLGELRASAAQVPAVANQLPPAERREIKLARLDLERRLDLWETAAVAARGKFVALHRPAGDTAMQQALADVAVLLSAGPAGDTWRNYLMLVQLQRLAIDSGDNAAEDRRRIAKTILERMADSRLSPAQREFLAKPPLSALKQRLRGWAVEPLGVGELLHTVEDYEQARSASLGRTLAEQSAVLADSPDAAQQRLGRELARQYRNANVRLVVTADLLNRILPQPEPMAEPVRDTIVGVPARGHSMTSARLSVRLFPAADEVRLGIEAAGVVTSQTASTSGPVTFNSQGESSYQVGKLVVIDRGGLRVGAAMAEANNRTRLSGLQTDFDALPLVRNLVRGYALAQHDEKRDQARQEVEAKVAARAIERFDAEVNERLVLAESEFRRRVLVPLERLDLTPTVAQLATTGDRATVRLRLAGDDQAGAHTPRPLAMSDSMLSLQVHESALNNALERFELAGRTFTLPELYQWIGERLGRTQVVLPEELPADVVITFADEDPVRVRFSDGRIELALAFAELDDGRRVWTDFDITVCYHPRYEGLRLEFAREGPIELGGEYAGRTEVVLRGIFNKVFHHRRKLTFEPATAAQNPALSTLGFSSALVDNGWISVTVADRARSAASR